MSSAERDPPALLRANWYDGRTPHAKPAVVWLEPAGKSPRLHWQPIGGERLSRDGQQVGWPERFSLRHPPSHLTIDLREQGSLELADVPGWYEAYEAAGAKAPLSERMQTRWRVFAGVLVMSVAVIFALYRWGTPWLATRIAGEVPLRWELALTDGAMADMDKHWFKPTKLPPERQADLRARFAALAAQVPAEHKRYADYQPRLQLHFRRGLGPNALALPGGTVIMTDEMVELAEKHKLGDEALVGVLAHEIGHVMHRHTTRMVVEQGVLNIGLGLALGDVSWIMSTGASLLTGLAYRRGHESEADCFAVNLMRKAGLRSEPMGELLLRLEAEMRGGQDKKPQGPGIPTLLSSHPDTHERAVKLKASAHGACR
jgi:Zn-dependent protease with chaperone function